MNCRYTHAYLYAHARAPPPLSFPSFPSFPHVVLGLSERTPTGVLNVDFSLLEPRVEKKARKKDEV